MIQIPDNTMPPIKVPESQPFVPKEIRADALDLKPDQMVQIIDENTLGVINEQLEPHTIKFEMHDDKATMLMIDQSTDRVIREIPNRELEEFVTKLKEAQRTGKNVGILIDEIV